MRTPSDLGLCLSLVLTLGLASCGDQPDHADHAGHAAHVHDAAAAHGPGPAATPHPSGIAVYVGGTPIQEQQVSERAQAMLAQQAGAHELGADARAALLASVRPQVVEQLIGEAVLDAEAARLGLSVTDEELAAELDRNLVGALFRENMTRQEFEQRLDKLEGITLQQYLQRQADALQLRRFLLHARWAEHTHPDEMAVSDADVRARYEELREQRFTSPELVRASHILVHKHAGAADPAAARDQAQALAQQARQSGADFAELARQNSVDPLAKLGGDLGYFPREGVMVEPFAAAAFALEIGEVSDVVETDFGYHVIRVTGRQPPRTYTFEEVEAMLRHELRIERAVQTLERHFPELRGQAEVRYP